MGCAVALTSGFDLDPSDVLLVEGGEAVATSTGSFRPDEMRFLSPTFYKPELTLSFNLYSVAHGLRTREVTSEHSYADYLDELAGLARLHSSGKRLRSEVVEIIKEPKDGILDVHVRIGGGDGEQRVERLRTRFVVWAASEFQLLRSHDA